MPPSVDLTGQRFGRLIALRPTKARRQGRVMWHCRCDCGQTTRAQSVHLRTGGTQSCGCLQRERSSQANRKE